ncbi:MAG: Zn-dependent hydrolase [Bacteroidales bacterium]|jgi:hypothetical protein|nr:Zn-dependent hydrolase [Bacteroidales bacterium]
MKKIGVISLGMFMLMNVFSSKQNVQAQTKNSMKEKVEQYAQVRLSTDISYLSPKEKQILSIFFDVSKIMDDLYWKQTFGNKNEIMKIKDKDTREFAMINYGYWDRMDNMKPFVKGVGSKPLGCTFYPQDMTKQEFEKIQDNNKTSLYTVVRRDKQGKLIVKWYHQEYKQEIDKAVSLLNKAVALAEDEGLKTYLKERIKALQTDDYYESDLAWMNMKNSDLDFVVGPIENYEDRLFGYKAAYEAFILVKDPQWSKNLSKYIKLLPELQKGLPCEERFKQEVPGTESDINVYDVVYYGGDCNAGGKTIAINLPNDEKVQIKKGSRRFQLKNAMKAKFDNIVIPIAKEVMNEEQMQKINFNAFFSNVTFHEVAHGLGIKNTINGKGTARQALKNQYSAYEEAKADVLGLYMVSQLIKKGEITNITEEESITTFIAGIFRSVRFGASEAHGQANMMCFNFFEKAGAFTRDDNGRYTINYDKARQAIADWSALVLKIEGTGDYDFAQSYAKDNATIHSDLQKDLDNINSKGIPIDIRYIQGKQELGLK